MKANTLISKLFIPDDNRALDIFRCIRWADGVYCPECKSFDIYKRVYID